MRSIYGVRFVANYRDTTFRLYIMAFYGFFYWRRLSQIAEDFVFLDIGANQGLYTICAARNKRCQGVYAFEPVANVVELLRRNLALNKVSDKCVVMPKAISNHSGDVEIFTNPDHSGVATIAVGNISVQTGQSEIIQTIHAPILQDIVQTHNLPIYVKIDVEGHEEIVIQELLQCRFFGQIREIFYEVDCKWVNPQVLQTVLEQAGFHTTKIGGESHYDVLATRG